MIQTECNTVQETFTALCTDDKLKVKSASGGAFVAIVEKSNI